MAVLMVTYASAALRVTCDLFDSRTAYVVLKDGAQQVQGEAIRFNLSPEGFMSAVL